MATLLYRSGLVVVLCFIPAEYRVKSALVGTTLLCRSGFVVLLSVLYLLSIVLRAHWPGLPYADVDQDWWFCYLF